jgi:predicted ATPase
LAARIDRLAPDHKDLLQTLAVIGTEFKLGLVRKVLDLQSEIEPSPAGRQAAGLLSRKITGEVLEPMLSELQLGEFIYEQPAVGDVEYIFKHALTHDVAYHSVLNERRRMLHERIGAALESMHAESLEDHVAELAHHYARSGNPGRAVEYCLRAVQQCAARASFAEAVAQFETGLEQLQKLPDDDRRAELELDLRMAGGFAVAITKGPASPEHEKATARLTELRQRLTIDFEKTRLALGAAFLVQFVRPDMRKACEVAGELIALAEERGGTVDIAEAATLLAVARTTAGDFNLAAEGFERGWALLESDLTEQHGLTPQPEMVERRPLTQARNRGTAAANLWLLGYPDRALERFSVADAIAHESGSKFALAVMHLNATIFFEFRRELEPMRERAAATLESATEIGNIVWRAQSEILLGWAEAMAGDLDGGIARIRHHLSELRATGSELAVDYFLALTATALGRKGQFDEGVGMIDESFQIVERTGARRYEAEIHRLKGELLLAQDASNAVPAEQSFRTAIEISRQQHAKSWELRTTTSLARLLDRQGKRDEARAMLAEIYGWFTEGFDTADLKDAKALLDELGG